MRCKKKKKLTTVEVITFEEYMSNKDNFKNCRLSLVGNWVLVERWRDE